MRDLKKKLLSFFKLTKNILVKFWPVLLIILVVLTFFWKVVIKKEVPIPGDFIVGVYYPWLDYKWGYPTGVPVKNPITSDVVSLIYPEQMLVIDLIKKGDLPLWNPNILGGTPLFANLQAAPFSPTNFVYFFLDKVNGWSVQIILQHLLACLFTYILLRHWKLSKLGSIFGGVIYSFSGFNVIFSQWNGHALASAFIPLILLLVDKIIGTGKYIYVVGLSLSLVFQLLSGYPQTSLYTALAIAILMLVRFFEDRKIVLKRSPLIILSGVFALGIAAVQILPTAELWKLSERSFEPSPFEWTFLPWKKLITFIAPDYFGNHATQNYWGPQDYTSNTAFIGVVAFTLALLGSTLVRKSKNILFFIFLVILSLILSFPTFVSIFLWKNNIFGFQAASAHRATILFTFAGAALAAYGFDNLREKLKYKNLLVGIVIISLIIMGFAFYALSLKGIIIRGIPISSVALRNLVFPAVTLILTSLIIFSPINHKIKQIVILLICVVELFRFGWKYTPFSPKNLIFPDTPILSFLKSQTHPFRVTGNQVIPINLRTPYKLESLEGYETIQPLRNSQFITALNSNDSGASQFRRFEIIDNDISPLLDLVNTKYYLAVKLDKKGIAGPEGKIPDRFDSKRFVQVFEDKSVAVLESKTALPRAFMVYDWEIENDDKKILDKLLESNFPLGKKIILEEKIGEVKASTTPPVSQVYYKNYQEQESIIGVKTEKEGMLFVSDAWYPGWKAFVDGKETKIYRADFAFRAIPIPQGEHEVRFIYQPESFSIGVEVSIISLLILFSLWPILKLLGKRKA